MENRRDLTKELLASCFKELMLEMPFEKITIKKITDKAGLIRPTFYKHFQDKYEVLEWILQTEIYEGIQLMIKNHMELDALLLLCRSFEKEKRFYRRCLNMEESPNSFKNILTRYTKETLSALFEKRPATLNAANTALTQEMLAAYYSYGLVNVLIDWLMQPAEHSADELTDTFLFLFSHPITDFIPAPEEKAVSALKPPV